MTERAGWPFWYTDARRLRPLGIWVWIAVGMIAVVLPPAFAGICAGMIHLLGLYETTPFREILSLMQIVLVSGFFAWVGVIIGIFACRYALSKGVAGWGVALAAGMVLPTLVFCVLLGTTSFLGVMVFFGTIGAVYAGCLWLGLRWLEPGLFAKE